MELREFLNLSETLLPFATGGNLDLIGEIFGVTRIGAATSSVSATDQNFRFYVRTGTFGDINNGQDIVIPDGVSIFTANLTGPVYLAYPITLRAGDSSTYFTVRAAAPGSAGNATASVFTSHNFTNYANAAYGSLLVTNDYGVVGGRDAETDDDYRYRINLKLQSQSGVNEAALRFALLQVPGIPDVVFDRHAGTFDCYVYSISPQVAASLLSMVQQTINDNVAFPLTGNAVAPDLVGISLTTTLHMTAGLSATDQQSAAANATAAAEDYINNLPVGQPLVINTISDKILSADSRILDVGDPNKLLAEIYVWKSRPDGSRYSRFLLTEFMCIGV
ncbi:MAG: baseplate J/gp47 family protein [Bryobacteraceae bacterium]|jgi:uncharacterized phage protein gp47/JayE